jgi:hypothetical protein
VCAWGERDVVEVSVCSWSELQEALFEPAWQPELGRHRTNEVFRGERSSNQGLATSLACLGGDFALHEQPLLRNFRKYARRDAVSADSQWDWLALGKHHGLPTRVLDWSFSPLVAAHFATAAPLRREDAVVWCIDHVHAAARLPAELREMLREERTSVFTTEMLSSVASSFCELDKRLGPEGLLFFEPPSLDQRIVNQFAVFSLQGAASAAMVDWLQRNGDLVRRIVIPADVIPEIRDKLDQANVNERVLFPGLDGLSRWLARHYSTFGMPTPAPAPTREPRTRTTRNSSRSGASNSSARSPN